MGNKLQSNPSDATHDFEQPDWNSAHGHGVTPSEDHAVDLAENYDAQRADAAERAAARQPRKMAGDKTK